MLWLSKLQVCCPKCPLVIANEKLFGMHIKNHQAGTEYQCDICQKTFKSLNDARTHSRKACGNITPKEVVIDVEEAEENHRCNACSTSYHSNEELEKHMDKHHVGDCPKCHITFKSEEDIYKHANVCSEVLEPIICEKCNCELITKAGLEKHVKRCKGENRPGFTKTKQQQSKEKCTNGPMCRFLKENRCLFVHNEQNRKHSGRSEEPWQTVQRRRPKQVLHCNNCEEKFNSREEKQRHKCQHAGVRRQDRLEPSTRREDIECFRGPNCFRLANDTCWFKHSLVQNSSSHRGQEKASNTTLWCKYQDKCTNSSCAYKHFGQGFQKTQSRKRL